MNDQDWFKKFRPHKGGGCTVVLLALGLVLLALLAGGQAQPAVMLTSSMRSAGKERVP